MKILAAVPKFPNVASCNSYKPCTSIYLYSILRQIDIALYYLTLSNKLCAIITNEHVAENFPCFFEKLGYLSKQTNVNGFLNYVRMTNMRITHKLRKRGCLEYLNSYTVYTSV